MDKQTMKGYFEITSFIQDSNKNFKNTELLEAMSSSQVRTFGWPIGIVMNHADTQPKSKAEGLVAELNYKDSYDYWKLTKSAELYILISLFEDRRREGVLFFDSRINRTTEALMRIGLLYSKLGYDHSSVVAAQLEYGGLLNRTLSVASPRRFIGIERKCTENMYSGSVIRPLHDYLSVETLKEMVYNYLHPLFELFDYFDADQNLVFEIVESYYNGKVI